MDDDSPVACQLKVPQMNGLFVLVSVWVVTVLTLYTVQQRHTVCDGRRTDYGG